MSDVIVCQLVNAPWKKSSRFETVSDISIKPILVSPLNKSNFISLAPLLTEIAYLIVKLNAEREQFGLDAITLK